MHMLTLYKALFSVVRTMSWVEEKEVYQVESIGINFSVTL